MEFLTLQDVPRHTHTALSVNSSRAPSRREGRELMSIRDIRWKDCSETEERSLSPRRGRSSSVDPATVAAELRRVRLQGLDRLPSARNLLSLGSASSDEERRPATQSRENHHLPSPVVSHYYRLGAKPRVHRPPDRLLHLAEAKANVLTSSSSTQTNPSRHEETRQELPPISELFDSVDSSYARSRQDQQHAAFPERRPGRIQPEQYPSGNYTTHPAHYQASPAYQPRPYGRSSLRADYEPRIAAAEQWDTSRAASSASSIDGHSIPGHGQHPSQFARSEVHLQPHAGNVPHVIAPFNNHPYQQHYAYEHQYNHPPHMVIHPETGQYYQGWHAMDVVGPVDQYGGRKRRGNLPKDATNQLKRWFALHGDSPYPSEEEKQVLASQTGLGMNQISNWFINARRRQPGRDAKEALQREQEARQAREAQQHALGGSSQASSTPSPTDESSGSIASIEQDSRRHQASSSRYDHRSSPPNTRSGGAAQPYGSPLTRHSERHAHHRSARRSSTPETRRDRRTR